MIEDNPIQKIIIWFFLLLIIPLSSWFLVDRGFFKTIISPLHGSFVAIVMVNVVLFMIIIHSIIIDNMECKAKAKKPKYKLQ